MQSAFELESGMIDKTLKPLSVDIFYWINRAIEKFTKTRYDGYNPKREGFEQTQKRIDDLRTLVKEVTISTTTGSTKPNGVIATLPNDYMFMVGEEVDVTYTDNHSVVITQRDAVTETNVNSYAREIKNTLGEYNLHYGLARPLRLFYGNTIELITDGNYTVPTYYLRYIKVPAVVALPSTNCDLPTQCHSEIVKMAVGMYVESIKDDGRYKTIENELNTME